MPKVKQTFKIKRKVRVKKYGEGKDPKVDMPDEIMEFPEEILDSRLPFQAGLVLEENKKIKQ